MKGNKVFSLTFLPLLALIFLSLIIGSGFIGAADDQKMGSLSKKSELNKLPFLNPELTPEQRATDLVTRLTLEEKIGQLMNNAPAIDRLGIPKYNWWNECLHGVARAGLATVFPQAIGLAATWDTDLMFQVATAISDEARAKHHEATRRGQRGIYQGLTFWSPNINLFRDPRWGRGMETYGEDPYLTGIMAVSFIRGLQGVHPFYFKVIATAKHYAVHSGPEPDRHTFDAVVDFPTLRSSYLPHFEMAVREGRAYSVMCAYNRFQGLPCCGSPPLLADILRREWGFEGYVVSDCDAVDDIYATHKLVPTLAEAAAMALKAGTDLNCGRAYSALLDAVKKGLLDKATVDTALKRLFVARFRLGMFDPPERVPYASIPYSVVDSPAHRTLALEAARKSIVLLQNRGEVLPLPKSIKTLAVIGPNADDVEVLLGNYNGFPAEPITPLHGLKEMLSPHTEIIYEPGTDWAEGIPVLTVIPSEFLQPAPDSTEKGLKAEYFNNQEFKGKPAATRIDSTVDFNWWEEAPLPSLDPDNFSIRWTGYLIPPETGDYYVGGEGFNTLKIYLDGQLIAQYNGTHETHKIYKKVHLEKGKPAALKIEFSHRARTARMHLQWKKPAPDAIERAITAARRAEAVILFLGLSPRLEGEEMNVPVKGFKGGDRMSLDLPENQEKLLQEVVRAVEGKPVVLVLLNGSPLSINRAVELVPAIVEAWYPGQAAGQAIAEALFGDYNPAGRLPVTFYKSADDLPPFIDYRMEGRTYRYFKKEPLFPFGYGLSYTRFRYSRLKVPKIIKSGAELTISVEVKNIGPRDGEEVVQVYLSRPESKSPVNPVRWLAAYKRIFLRAGEKQKVTLTIRPKEMMTYDGGGQPVIEKGPLVVSVGGQQPGFTGRLSAPTTSVLTTRIKIEN
ncbi:MAG: glycoside hydrolase family 3 C-terminal domain-containing protein [Candidatus Saccharicenans sp.]|uniref:glycoside hydrolase family 3 C-terminal domain-containing protein n=1 Tax=Candidatus Saccharicenans sp. TaxID=2819258 RepID=UPI00404A238B